jgi:hypothetical protein
MLIPIPFLGWFEDEEETKPMPYEKIIELWLDKQSNLNSAMNVIEFVREIEKHHGIH